MNIDREKWKIIAWQPAIFLSYCFFLYVALSTASVFAESRFITVTTVNSVNGPRDWLAPTVTGVVNIEIGSVNNLDQKVATSTPI